MPTAFSAISAGRMPTFDDQQPSVFSAISANAALRGPALDHIAGVAEGAGRAQAAWQFSRDNDRTFNETAPRPPTWDTVSQQIRQRYPGISPVELNNLEPAFRQAQAGAASNHLLQSYVNRFREGMTPADYIDYWQQAVPLGGGATLDRNRQQEIAAAGQRISSGNGLGNDYAVVGRYLAQMERQTNQPWYRNAGDLVVQSIPYALDFSATGATYGGARQAVAAGLQRTLGTSLAARVTTAVASRAAGVAALTGANPARITQQAQAASMPSMGLAPGANPQFQYQPAQQDFVQNLPGAVAHTGIEMGSELAGHRAMQALGWLGSRIPGGGRLAANVLGPRTAAAVGMGGGQLPTALGGGALNRFGFHGVPGEMLEERIAELGHMMAGQEPIGVVQGYWQNARAALTGPLEGDRPENSMDNVTRQLATELLGFAGTGGLLGLAGGRNQAPPQRFTPEWNATRTALTLRFATVRTEAERQQLLQQVPEDVRQHFMVTPTDLQRDAKEFQSQIRQKPAQGPEPGQEGQQAGQQQSPQPVVTQQPPPETGQQPGQQSAVPGVQNETPEPPAPQVVQNAPGSTPPVNAQTPVAAAPQPVARPANAWNNTGTTFTDRPDGSIDFTAPSGRQYSLSFTMEVAPENVRQHDFPEQRRIRFRVTDQAGNRAGNVDFYETRQGLWQGEDLWVEKPHRFKAGGGGVAEAMYDFMAGEGLHVVPAGGQTTEGKQLWARNAAQSSQSAPAQVFNVEHLPVQPAAGLTPAPQTERQSAAARILEKKRQKGQSVSRPQAQQGATAEGVSPPAEVTPPAAKLTAQEQQAKDLYAEKKSLRKTGAEMGVSHEQIRILLDSADRKLGETRSIAEQQAMEREVRRGELTAQEDIRNAEGAKPRDSARDVAVLTGELRANAVKRVSDAQAEMDEVQELISDLDRKQAKEIKDAGKQGSALGQKRKDYYHARYKELTQRLAEATRRLQGSYSEGGGETEKPAARTPAAVGPSGVQLGTPEKRTPEQLAQIRKDNLRPKPPKEFIERAAEAGVRADALQARYEQLRDHDRAEVDAYNEMLRRGRALYEHYAGKKVNLKAEQFEDPTFAARIDEAGDEIANEYPQFFTGQESPGDQLFHMLKDGPREAQPRDDLYEEALASLALPPGDAADHGLGSAADISFDPDSFGAPLTEEEKAVGRVAGGSTDDAGGRAPLRETALANRLVDKERAADKLPPLMAAARLENAAVWDQAMAVLDQNPQAGSQLAEDLFRTPRPTTVLENALLLQRKIALRNQYNRVISRELAGYAERRRLMAAKQPVAEIEAELDRLDIQEKQLLALIDQLDRVTRSTGTEWGRAGQFRRQLAAEDFSLSSMLMQARRAKRGDLTAAEREEIGHLQKQIEELQAKVAELEQAGEVQPGQPSEPGFRLNQAQGRFRQRLDAWERGSAPWRVKLARLAWETIDLPRSFMASIDFPLLRQGMIAMLTRPVTTLRTIPSMLRSFVSEEAADREYYNLTHRPNADLYEAAGLSLTSASGELTAREEGFLSNLINKLPIVGHITRASARSYATVLNRIRADVFDKMVSALARDGAVTTAEAKVLANWCNVMTGRGNLGQMERANVLLQRVFFAPKWVVSRFQVLLGQPLYTQPGLQAGRARLAVAKEYGRLVAAFGLVATLLALAGFGPEDDPRSAGFGKFRIGNVHLDFSGGLAAAFRLLAQTFSLSTTTGQGQVQSLRNPEPGQDSYVDVFFRFVRGKLAPTPGALLNMLNGTDVVGNEVTVGSTALSLATPLFAREVYEAVQDVGIEKGIAASLLGILGMGMQTYDPTPPGWWPGAAFVNGATPEERERQIGTLGRAIQAMPAEQRQLVLGGLLMQATTPRPTRNHNENFEHFQERMTEWQTSVTRVQSILAPLNLPPQERFRLLQAEWVRRQQLQGVRPVANSPAFHARARMTLAG